MSRSLRTPIRTALVAALAGLAALLSQPAGAAPTSASPAAVRWTDCSGGYVGLTYDDGPNPASTTALLSALQAGQAKATFFIWGQHADQYPDLLRSEQAAGMWIGNHTYTHPHLPQIGEPAAYQQMADTQSTVQRVTGQYPSLFRPPYGETNSQVKSDEAKLGMAEVLWSVDSQDWNGAGTAQIVQANATLRAGGIVLMHDGGYGTTVAAVPQILDGLAARHMCPGKITGTPGNAAVVTAP